MATPSEPVPDTVGVELLDVAPLPTPSNRTRSGRLPRARPDLRKIDVTKLKTAAVGKYKVYVEQLANAELPGDVIQDISTLGDLEILYRRRVVVEDVCAMLAIAGMVLMVIVNEIMADEAEQRPRSPDGRLEYQDSGLTWTMKLVVSVATAFVIGLLIERARINTKVRRLRNLLPPHASICNWDILWPLLLEIFVCALHIPPGWDQEVELTWARSRFHVNEMGCIMLLRVYMVARVIRNHSGYYSRMNAFIGSLHDVESASISFTLKLLFRNRPANLLVPCILCCIFVCTVCLRILERRSEDSEIESYYDALWVSIVTMSTVGYGDLVPQTLSGRIVVVVFGIVGGALLLTLVTAVFIEFLTLDDAERRVVSSIRRRDWERHLRFWSVTLIANGWRLRTVQKRIRVASKAGKFGEVRRQRKAELHASSKLFNAMFRFRRLRRSAPPAAVDDSEIRFSGIEAKLDLILDHLGIAHRAGGATAAEHGPGAALDARGVASAFSSSLRHTHRVSPGGADPTPNKVSSRPHAKFHLPRLRDQDRDRKRGVGDATSDSDSDSRDGTVQDAVGLGVLVGVGSGADTDGHGRGHRRVLSAEPSPRAGREQAAERRRRRGKHRRARRDSQRDGGSRRQPGAALVLGVNPRSRTVAQLV